MELPKPPASADIPRTHDDLATKAQPVSFYSAVRFIVPFALAVCTFPACEPALQVGEWSCNPNDAARPDPMASIAVPWSTSFEAEFCDYSDVAGFCYGDPNATYTTVMSPARSGRYAAAFRVNTDDARAQQTRCVRQGVFPTAAYYGAWYFVPARAENSDLWNLFHFRGGDPAQQHGLWDVSLINGDDGALELVMFDFLNARVRRPANPIPIPLGAWFHVELYLERAVDATGEVALYQDGRLLLRATDLITDDSRWGQWYVGNLASSLSPAESTLYVDDVSIRTSR